MRRKGETKLEKTWPEWGPGHPVASAISRGDSWFYAWLMQACTPHNIIERKTKISPDRIWQFERGERPTVDELRRLAELWKAPIEDIIASMPWLLRPDDDELSN